MNGNLYRHEVRQGLRSAWKWWLGLVFLHFLYLPFYPTFADQQAMVDAFMQQLPREYLLAFGIVPGLRLSEVLGYYTLIFVLVQMVLAVQASLYGLDLLTQEERYGTADFLLTRPLSRSQVFLGKLAAVLTVLLLTWAVLWASAWSSVALFHGAHPYDAGALALVLSSAFPFQLCFLAVGVALSLVVPKLRNSVPYGLGLTFGLYGLSAFADVQGNAVTDALAWLSPFRYFHAPDLVLNRAYDTAALVLSLAVTLAGLALAYALFRRRDIAATL